MQRPPLTARDLGIDIRPGDEPALFKWFIASFLFGKRVQQAVAARAYHVLVDEHGLDSPDKICRHSWQDLVKLLDEGHYVRYDESTADRLLQACRKLREEYGGSIGRLHDASTGPADLERRLLDFKGVGPKTVQIFLREAQHAWA
jgi:endonuclease III